MVSYFRLRSTVVILILISVTVTANVLAQSDCSPSGLADQFGKAMSGYSEMIASSSSSSAALSLVEDAQGDLDSIIDRCSNIAGASSETERSPGNGTIDEPYGFNVSGDTGSGFTIRVAGFIKPADTIIRNENMFNDRPQPGQVYVILDIVVDCLSGESRCTANYMDFEMVGDQGVVYEHPFVVMDNALDVKLFAGAQGSGRLVFLVEQGDANLKLLYRPNMFMDDVVVYAAEPDAGSGLQITASESINIRSAPSRNAGVVGTLSPNTPIVAFGRNESGSWLQISNGWVFAELVSHSGDVSSLPVTAP